MNIEEACDNMLTQQLRTVGVLNERVLTAFKAVPREHFIAQEYRDLAYADTRIPLPHDRKMATPREEARILQALDVKNKDKILVIDTSDGFLTALLAKLGSWVYSTDDNAFFTEWTRSRLEDLAIENVTLVTASNYENWEKNAPYDVIVITGSLLTLPLHFNLQLCAGGRLFVVLGQPPAMEATLITRITENQWQVDKLFETVWPRLSGYQEMPGFTF